MLSGGAPTLTEADSAGNTYVAGVFSGTTTFGAFSLSSGGGEDAFVGRLDSTGAWQWVQRVGGSGADQIKRLRLDARHNAVLLVGAAPAGGTVGTTALPSAGDYVARLNAATGAVRWAVGAEGAADVGAHRNGNLVVCGTFSLSLTLGTHTVQDPSTFSASELYVAGLDSIGVWSWLVGGGGEGDAEGQYVAVAANGDVIVGGRYMSMFDDPTFGQYAIPVSGGVDFNYFVAKLNSARTWQWARGVTNADRSDLADMALDAAGNVYLAAHGNDAPALNNTPLFPMTVTGNDEFYILSLTPGGTVRSVTRQTAAAVPSQTQSRRLRLVDNDKLMISGWMDAGATIQLGNYALSAPATPAFPVFFGVLDGTSQWQWAEVLPDVWNWAYARRHRLTFAGTFAQSSYAFGSTTLTNTQPPNTPQGFVAQRGLPALVDAFSPATGPAGTIVTLTGVGFAGTTAVLVGGVPAVFTVLGNGQVQITIPPGLPTGGAGVLIQVVGPNGTSLSPTRFQPRPVGLAETSAPLAFQLAPNPARGDVRVVGLPAAAQLTVLDCAGRVVSATTVGADATLHLHGLAPGVYTVRAGVVARRLVIE